MRSSFRLTGVWNWGQDTKMLKSSLTNRSPSVTIGCNALAVSCRRKKHVVGCAEFTGTEPVLSLCCPQARRRAQSPPGQPRPCAPRPRNPPRRWSRYRYRSSHPAVCPSPGASVLCPGRGALTPFSVKAVESGGDHPLQLPRPGCGQGQDAQRQEKRAFADCYLRLASGWWWCLALEKVGQLRPKHFARLMP